MTIPSVLDPTLAPAGCHVVQLFTQYTPYTLAGGRVWNEQTTNEYADHGWITNDLTIVNSVLMNYKFLVF